MIVMAYIRAMNTFHPQTTIHFCTTENNSNQQTISVYAHIYKTQVSFISNTITLLKNLAIFIYPKSVYMDLEKNT